MSGVLTDLSLRFSLLTCPSVFPWVISKPFLALLIKAWAIFSSRRFLASPMM
jgi:hypothetical protein